MASPASVLSFEDVQRSATSCVARGTLEDSDLDDLIQEGLITLMRVESRYRRVSPPQLQRLARRAVANRMTDVSRRARRRARWEAPFDIDGLRTLADRRVSPPSGTCTPGPLQNTILAELQSAVDTAIQGLSGRLGEVYLALYEDGLSQRQAALALGVSQPRIAHLHKRLRETLAPVLIVHW